MENKIQKFAKVIYILSKIARIATIVTIGFVLAAIVWLALNGEADGSIKLGENMKIMSPVSGFLVSKEDGIPNTIPAIGSVLAYVLTVGIIMLFILILVEQLFKRIKDSYTPFELKNALIIRRISVFVILYSIIPSLVGMITGMTLDNTYQLDSHFFLTGDGGSTLFIALIFFCFAEIFKYGCEIQQQVDETL